MSEEVGGAVIEQTAEDSAFDEMLGIQVEPDPTPEEGATDETQDMENTEANAEGKSEPSSLELKLENAFKQLENQKLLIDRQGNELGQLRRSTQEQEQVQEDPNEFLSRFAENPIEAQREIIAKELQNREQQRAQREAIVSNNRERVNSLVPEFENKMDGIKQWYRDKGANEEFVNSLNASQLYNNIDLAVALGELQTLKAQLNAEKGKGAQVLSKINKGASVVNGKSGQASGPNSDGSQILKSASKMSDAELEAALSKLGG